MHALCPFLDGHTQRDAHKWMHITHETINDDPAMQMEFSILCQTHFCFVLVVIRVWPIKLNVSPPHYIRDSVFAGWFFIRPEDSNYHEYVRLKTMYYLAILIDSE